MPWNDNSNPGPWGSPPPSGGKGEPDPKPSGQGPRRPPPGRGPNTPPDFEDLQRRLNDWLRGLNGGGGGPSGALPSRRVITLAAGALVALYFVSGLIVVGAREEAVVTTFGAWTRSYGPGVGYHLPIFEKTQKVSITTLQKTDIGGVPGATVPQESLMLTGDENIADLTFSVNWRISNPGRYLFNIDDPAATVMQRMLDSYGSGIVIDSVQIRDAQPPKEVVAAFQEVATAGQNAEAAINAARGEASKIRQQALGYRAQVVSEASGEAARFNQIYEQYKLAPGVTRDRLYIETMERVLSRSNKVIIDSKGASAPIVLSPDTFKARTPAGAAPAAAPRVPGAAQ